MKQKLIDMFPIEWYEPFGKFSTMVLAITIIGILVTMVAIIAMGVEPILFTLLAIPIAVFVFGSFWGDWGFKAYLRHEYPSLYHPDGRHKTDGELGIT